MEMDFWLRILDEKFLIFTEKRQRNSVLQN